MLRSLKYSDSKIIVDLYTEVYGRITSMVKLSSTPKGKMRKQLFQPLTSLCVEIDYRQRQQMQKLADVQFDQPRTLLTMDPVRMTIGMFLAEVLCSVTRQEQQDAPLYQFIAASLQWLDITEGSVANFHIAFLITLTQFLGFLPATDGYTEGMLFDLRMGEFTPLTPLHHDFLSPADTRRMYQLLRISYPTMHLYHMSRNERRQCLDTILYYYSLHIASFSEPKSLSILHEVFS